MSLLLALRVEAQIEAPSPVYLGGGGGASRPIIYLHERKREALEEIKEAVAEVVADAPQKRVVSVLQSIVAAQESVRLEAVSGAIQRLRQIDEEAAQLTRLIDALDDYQRISRMIEEEEDEEAAIMLMIA